MDKLIMGALILSALTILSALPFAISAKSERKAECTTAGGVYVDIRSGGVCLAPSAIVDVK